MYPRKKGNFQPFKWTMKIGQDKEIKDESNNTALPSLMSLPNKGNFSEFLSSRF
uniref:Uncharacterized protein n=1 Tax=Meloidogyne enterolobii TaxID=390850 RepID=A0A6V7XSL4_MELEN|nr:unnamed protein product [Meloidogyne enterolobii]